jgi:hypothetical protein
MNGAVVTLTTGLGSIATSWTMVKP